MCGIIGVLDDNESVLKAVKGLSMMKDRGVDHYGLSCGRHNILHDKTLAGLAKKSKPISGTDCLGHCLHSVVGSVAQPLKGKGTLIANCEIYNWKELDAKYNLGARNDSEMLLRLLDTKGMENFTEVLGELDGVYAFAYWIGDRVVVCRDIFGVKPVWYCRDGFASERKALEALGMDDVKELNPREILWYDLKKREIGFHKRGFYLTAPVIRLKKDKIKSDLIGLFVGAVAKRIPDAKFGILFSGGIDSVLIAKVCQELGVDFTCYTAALEPADGGKEAEDLLFAKKAAADLGLELKYKTIKVDEVERYLKKVVPLIEDNNVVKVGVGLTFHVACELARKDKIKVIFSGLGSEELYAGYERHKESADVNDECLSGLRKMYERDLYRDDVITMNNNLELRLPFLDRSLAAYSLRIPAKLKLSEKQNKIIIREVAESLGVPKRYSQRKKRAAQYGSRFDKAIEKLAKRGGFASKSAYLDKFYSRNPSLGVMFSSGKDSAYAMWTMMKQNYPIRCLITMKSRNPDSYMFHTPNIDMAKLQAKAMQVPIIIEKTDGEKETELKDMEHAIARAKKEYGIEGVVTGALHSQYQRERIEKVCDKLGLKIFSPLWHIDQEKEMRQLSAEGFQFVMSSIAAEGLNVKWLGRPIKGKDIDLLAGLRKKIGLNVAGEGGEFETLVLDGPMFKNRIEIEDSEVVAENEITARWVVKKARLVKK